MMNYVFPILLVLSFAAAAVQGRMSDLSAAVIQGGQDAVSLLLRLASMLCLWGGVMEIAEKSGITRLMAKLLSPLLKLIFPSLRKEKFAMEAISMNVTANILGLGNAATPLGLEAMRRLQEINEEKSAASDEMIVFVVMNTAAMHIIPTTVATLRGQYASADPMEIMPASILTSVCALTIAVIVAKLGNALYRRLRRREAKGGRRLSAVRSKGL